MFTNDTPDDFVKAPIQKMVADTQKNSTTGPIIGSFIVILLIITGGIYFWGSLITSKKVQIQEKQTQSTQTETAEIEKTAKQSNSDDVPAIEADIESTDIDSVDSNFDDIEKEF